LPQAQEVKQSACTSGSASRKYRSRLRASSRSHSRAWCRRILPACYRGEGGASSYWAAPARTSRDVLVRISTLRFSCTQFVREVTDSKFFRPPQSPAPQYTPTYPAGHQPSHQIPQHSSPNVYPNVAEMGSGEISAHAAPGSY